MLASQPRFSRGTVFAAINALESKLTQAEISSLFTDFGPSVYLHLPESGSAKFRMVALKRYIDSNPRTLTDDGVIENILVERAISLMPSRSPMVPWMPPLPLSTELEKLIRALNQDGFSVTDGEMRANVPAETNLPVAQTTLEMLLNKHGLSTTKGHLDQALDNHAAGNWASANSQIRSFIESLFDELATKLDDEAAGKKSGHERRTHLANLSPPFLDRALNEWSDNGVGFVNGLMARLHPQGSHPGLSDEEDSTFRLHIVLLTTRFFLSRFDSATK